MNRPFVFIGGIFSMRWIREHKIVSFLLVVIVLALGFIVFAAVTGGDGGIVSSGAGTAAGKIMQPFSALGSKIHSGFASFGSAGSLKNENEKLRKENESLKRQVESLTMSQNEKSDLEALKKALKYKGSGDSKDLVSGDVIAMDGTNWMNMFTINLGRERGVKKGDLVVNGDGLVGTVKTVGAGWSKVATLMDQDLQLSFMVKSNHKILGLLNGSTSRTLKGYTLDHNATIVQGDTIVTSGMGSYPAGITIGKVTNVRYDSNQQLQKITVAPAVDFQSLQQVAVLI